MGLIQPIPSFAQGYATHQACVAPWAWKGNVAAYAPFLGIQGNKLYDFSGFGNHGTLNGPTWVPGKYGPALKFDGLNDIVNLGTPGSLQITTMTIVAWIKRSVIGANHSVFMSTTAGYAFWVQSTNKMSFTKNGTSEVLSTGTITDTNWHQIALTYDGSTVKFYIDGSLDSSPAYADPGFATTQKTIGALPGPALPFNGKIRGISIYNRVLSAAEIAWHYYSLWAMFQRQISPAMFFVPVSAEILDLFNPQLRSLKQEYQLQSEKQEHQIKSLKQEGQIKWLQ